MHTGEKVATFSDRFSELVTEYTTTKGFNETDLARDLYSSKQTINAWKSGKRSPKQPTVITIANFFNVSVAWLNGFDVEKSADTINQDKQEQNDKHAEIINKFNLLNPENRIRFDAFLEGLLAGQDTQ